MSLNIITLGQVNEGLKFASVTAAQLIELGFYPLANKPICEALPLEESRRLRNAKLYPADSISKIRAALAERFGGAADCGQPADCGPPAEGAGLP